MRLLPFAPPLALAVIVSLPAPPAQAADAGRGSALYLRLPGGLNSCVSCHGPDPAANRNNLLRAASQPDVLLKALNAVGVMGYLKPELQDTDLADLAAYLDTVARAAADDTRAVWPRTIEFGSFAPGTVSPVHEVWLRNRSAAAMALVPPRLTRGLFMLSHDCPPVLAAGTACRASLSAAAAAPMAPGDFTDALVWPAATPVVVGLSATASANTAAALATDRTVLDFGEVKVGDPALQRLSLRNTGAADITLGVSTLTGPGAAGYALDGDCGSGRLLAAGAGCTLEISFRPGAGVPYEAALQWRSSGTNPAPVRLEGRGLTTPLSAPPTAPTAAAPGDGGAGGGGGCAALPPAARGDASLLLWLAAAATALAVRHRLRRVTALSRRLQ